MMGGLRERDLRLIVEMLLSYSEVKEARLFGSRAKGNYKPGSDIDIALLIDSEDQSRREALVNALHDNFEEKLPLPYFFDVIDYDSITSSDLKEHIDRVGVVIYKKEAHPRANDYRRI